MGRYRIYLLVALVIALVTAATMSLSGAQRYYPLVRVHMPDNITLVFADTPWPMWRNARSGAEDSRSAAQELQRMPDRARLRNAAGSRMAKGAARRGDQPSCRAIGTLRIAIDAGAASRQLCDAMVAQIGKEQKQPARCVAPQ